MKVSNEISESSGGGTGNAENVGPEVKRLPKDAHVMASILRDMGIVEWEPRVINQLMEFSYNYVTTVIDNAKIFSNHARKEHIDVDDVRVAVQMYTDKNVTSPPPRDMLLEVARTKNSSTLPIPKSTSGLRLPPDRFCLTSCNLKLKSNKKQPPRSGPYYYGSAAASTTSSMMIPKNKVMMGPPPTTSTTGASAAVSNSLGGQQPSPVSIPTFTMTPQGGLSMASNQMRPVAKMQVNPVTAGRIQTASPAANKIQIQPTSTGGGPAMFTMTINPNNSPMVKREPS